MAFFKKKGAGAEKSADAGPKVKRHTETMASVLKESVVETAMAEFKENPSFIVQHNGGTYYVGLWLDTSRIGGLSKKNSRDEAKGQLIESITGGHISVLITGEMMERECMILIPTRDSLEAINEYSILRELDYPLCYVYNDGENIEITDVTTTVQDCIDLLSVHGDITVTLRDMLPGKATEEAAMEEVQEENGEPMEVPEEPVEKAPESAAAKDDGAGFEGAISEKPAFENLGEGYEEEEPPDGMPFGSAGNFSDEEPLFGEYDGDPDGDGEDDGEDDDAPEPEEDYTEEVSEADFQRALTRRLYSDDLGLEITTEPFDSQFMHGNEPISFATDRPEGWLNDQLNQMSRAANTELKRIHMENLLKCRAQYFTLVSKYCEDIQTLLDYTDTATEFGKMYESLGDQYRDSLDHIDGRIDERKRTLIQNYEANIRNASETAAAQAAQDYRERHGKQHSDQLYHIDSECREALKDELDDGIRQMNDMRRAEAAKRLDLGVTAALEAVTESYMKLLDEEQAAYERLRKEMETFVSENRENEIFRVKTLAEEQAQSDKANAVMAEYAAKMQALRSQFEGQEQLLKSQIDTMRRQHSEAMDNLRLAHQTEVNGLNDRLASSASESEVLRGQIARMDEVKDKQYESRMQELAGEREAFSRKYEHLVDLQKKTGAIIIIAAVVGIIAALAVGFAAGMFMTRDSGADIQNIQLPDGYVLVQDEDGSARVVEKAVQDALQGVQDDGQEPAEPTQEGAQEGSETQDGQEPQPAASGQEGAVEGQQEPVPEVVSEQ